MSTSIRLIAPPCPPFFMAHASCLLFVHNGHATQNATQADDRFPALDALAGDLELVHGFLEVGEVFLEDAEAPAYFQRPCLVAPLHVAEVEDVPGQVADFVIG